nr:hypothetical protein [Mycoplasmopsis bovis]
MNETQSGKPRWNEQKIKQNLTRTRRKTEYTNEDEEKLIDKNL